MPKESFVTSTRDTDPSDKMVLLLLQAMQSNIWRQACDHRPSTCEIASAFNANAADGGADADAFDACGGGAPTGVLQAATDSDNMCWTLAS
jgi:hypothetical protein